MARAKTQEILQKLREVNDYLHILQANVQENSRSISALDKKSAILDEKITNIYEILAELRSDVKKLDNRLWYILVSVILALLGYGIHFLLGV